MDHEHPHIISAEKPRWFKSPLGSDRLRRPSEAPPHRHDDDAFKISELRDCNNDDEGCYDGYPPFQRYEEPTLLEILYDLFFAANYNVFAQNQSVTNHSRFKAYVGYFSLLWGTWFVVTLYDVRYVTDSIFERVARAVQLGVLVGFTVVAPNFNPEDQNQSTMMTMSLILCTSRVCLAIEYAHTLIQIFKYKRARRPLYLQIAINVISAAVYLGITFRFQKQNSRVYVTWYIFTGGEAILTLVLSNFWRTLSFTRTHLMKRLSLLTVMILGEGIQTVAQNIATIVKTPDAWNPYTVGVITAATATIYCVFLVYFDWMRHLQLPALRQQLWTSLHYPFHLALVLFMQGFTQLILWGKAFNVFEHITGDWLFDTSDPSPGAIANVTSGELAAALVNKTSEIFTLYPPKYPEVRGVVNASIANISAIPDALWPALAEFQRTRNESSLSSEMVDAFATFGEQLVVVISAMANSVFTSFNIDLATELKAKHPNDTSPIKSSENQVILTDKTTSRSRLVFAYTYVACGCTLILLVMMALISRMSPLGRLPRLRFVACALAGIGIGLTALLFFAPDKADSFLAGPWPIPTVLFGWFLATLLVHIRGSRSRSAISTLHNIFGLFRPRRRNPVPDLAPRDTDADSQQVAFRFWAPTRENTGLSAAATVSNAEGNARDRRLSLRAVSPTAAPHSEPPSPRSKDPEQKFLEVDASNQV
ncbi:hypothetical protein PWT90_00949 [Aphanocladium album]|nr:hypothetical protein PWT90_00949 [Aphanocladium album]